MAGRRPCHWPWRLPCSAVIVTSTCGWRSGTTVRPFITDLPLTLSAPVVGLRPADISLWPGCELSLTCQEGLCQTASLEVAALQDLLDDPDTTNVIEVEVWSEEDPAWAHYKVDPVLVHVETLPTASCYVMTDPHIITFDQASFDLYTTGTFLLSKTVDGTLEVQVRLWQCGSVSCVCGLVAREGDDVVSVDMCTGDYGDAVPGVKLYNIRHHVIHTKVFEAREGKILLIEFPSGRSIQAFIEYWGISFSLRASGADHGQTR